MHDCEFVPVTVQAPPPHRCVDSLCAMADKGREGKGRQGGERREGQGGGGETLDKPKGFSRLPIARRPLCCRFFEIWFQDGELRLIHECLLLLVCLCLISRVRNKVL